MEIRKKKLSQQFKERAEKNEDAASPYEAVEVQRTTPNKEETQTNSVNQAEINTHNENLVAKYNQKVGEFQSQINSGQFNVNNFDTMNNTTSVVNPNTNYAKNRTEQMKQQISDSKNSKPIVSDKKVSQGLLESQQKGDTQTLQDAKKKSESVKRLLEEKNTITKNNIERNSKNLQAQGEYYGNAEDYGGKTGNIDLNKRKVYYDENGNYLTEESIGIRDDKSGKEVLIPTIINGKKVSDEEAIKHYEETGEHLASFDNIDDANKYAEDLHLRQQETYKNFDKDNRTFSEKINDKIEENRAKYEAKQEQAKINEELYDAYNAEKKAMQQERYDNANGIGGKILTAGKNAVENVFQKPATFYDGYQFGDIGDTIRATTTGGIEHFAEGMLKIPDILTKAVAYRGAEGAKYLGRALSQLYGQEIQSDEFYMEKWLNAIGQYSENKANTFRNVIEKLGADKKSILGSTGNAAAEGAGQSKVLGVVGTGSKKAADLLTFLMGYSNGLEQTYTDEELKDLPVWEKRARAVTGGLASYISENITENQGYGIGWLDGKVGDLIDGINNSLIRTTTNMFYKGFGEAFEEVVEPNLNAFGDVLIDLFVSLSGKGKKIDPKNEYDIDSIVNDAFASFLSAFASNGGEINQHDLVTEAKKIQTIADEYESNNKNTNETISQKNDLVEKTEVNQNDAEMLQKQPSTIENKPILNQEQQSISNDSKIDGNQLSKEIEENTQNETKNIEDSKIEYEEYKKTKQEANKSFEETAQDILLEEKEDDAENNSPLEDRNYKNVGKDKNLNAYQYDNPDVKPYFQYMAENLKEEVEKVKEGTITAKGKGTIVTYENNVISEIKQQTGLSYAKITEALDNIIKDEGSENNANAKKVEIAIDKALREGYIATSKNNNIKATNMEATQEYLDLINGRLELEYDNKDLGNHTEKQSKLLEPKIKKAQNSESDLVDENDNVSIDEKAILPKTAVTSAKVSNEESISDIAEELKSNSIENIKEPKYKEHAGYKTLENSDNISKETVKRIEKARREGKTQYAVESNNEQINKSYDRLNKVGMDTFYEDSLNGLEKESSKLTGQDKSNAEIALIELEVVAADQRNNGQVEEAIETEKKIWNLIYAMNEANTDAARFIQAGRIINKVDGIGQSVYLDRQLKKVSEMNNGIPVNVSEESRSELMHSKGKKEIDAAWDKIKKEVSNQVPMSFYQRLNNWRYFSMLANPQTHIRNIGGNTSNHVMKFFKNEIDGVIQDTYAAISKLRGKEYNQTNTIKMPSREIKTFAREYTESIEFDEDSKYNESNDIKKSLLASQDSKIGIKGIDQVAKFNTKALNVEDVIAMKWEFRNRFAKFLTANNYTLEDVKIESGDSLETLRKKQEILNEATKYAMEEAKVATFHENNAIAEGINQLNKAAKKPFGGKLFTALTTDSQIPFVKTPLNILKTGIEYSPANLITTTTTLVDTGKEIINSQKAYDAKIKKAELLYKDDKAKLNKETAKIKQEYTERTSEAVNKSISSISKGFTGFGLTILGMVLGSKGLVRADDDDDKESWLSKLGFDTSYSVQIGGASISADWLAPAFIPIFIGVSLQHELEKLGDDATLKEKLEAIPKGTWKGSVGTLVNMSLLESLNNTLQSLNYAEKGEKLDAYIASATSSYITQIAKPTIFTKIKNMFSPEYRDTSTIKKGTDRYITSTKNQLLSTYYPEALNIKKNYKGEEISRDNEGMTGLFREWFGDNVVSKASGRFLDNFIIPSKITYTELSDVEEKIVDLYDETQADSIIPTNNKVNKTLSVKDTNGEKHEIKWTDETYSRATIMVGEKSTEVFNTLFKNERFNELSPDEQVELINDIYSYAKEEAKAYAASKQGIKFASKNDLYNTIQKVKNVGGETSDYIDYLVSTKDMTRQEKISYINDQKYSSNKDKDTKIRNAIYQNDVATYVNYNEGKDQNYEVLNVLTSGKVSNGYTQYKEKLNNGEFKAKQRLTKKGTYTDITGIDNEGSRANNIYTFLNSTDMTTMEKISIMVNEGYQNSLGSNELEKYKSQLENNRSSIDEEKYESIMKKIDEVLDKRNNNK